MSASARSPDAVLAELEALGPPGTPVTTPEVAAAFDCSDRTIYNRLDALVEVGSIETKKVGAKGRVWWKPVDGDIRRDGSDLNQHSPVSLRDGQAPSFCADSEMAERIREFDWSDTPLGPMDEWPMELRVAVDIMLGADEAVGIYGGEDLTLLYNDAWQELIGDKHPDALGQPAREVFPELWESIGPMFADVLNGTGAASNREQRLPLDRDGQLEDAWFDYSANLIPMADGSIGGIFNVAVEVTERKRLEQELGAEKEKLDVAVENSPLVLFRMDTDLRYTWVKNPDRDFEDVDVLGKREDEFLPPETAETLMGPKRRALETGDRVREEVTYELPSRQVTYDLTVFPVRDESGEITGLVCSALNITERKEAEQELQQQAELDAFRVDLTDAIRSLTDTEEIQRTAARVLGEQLDVDRAHYGEVLADGKTNRVLAGYARDDVFSLDGEHNLDDYGEYIADGFRADDTLVVDNYRELSGLSEAERSMYDQAEIAAWVGVPLHKDGDLAAYFVLTESEPRVWTDAEVEMVEETADRTWAAIERGRAEEVLRKSEAARQRLNDATRELIDAETGTIDDRVVPLMREVLDVEYAALWRYDDQSGDLDEHTVDADPDLDSTAGFSDGLADRIWETFVGTGVDVTNDLDGPTDGAASLRSRTFVPLGRHGVVCLGSTRADTFDERTLDLMEAVASTVETAWDRAESEDQLARQNEELQRLDRLNTLIRGIDRALVSADSRETVEEVVCEQLATSDLNESAWLATYDADTDTLRPQAWAGVDSRFMEDRRVTLGDASSGDPLVAAHRSHEIQVVSDIATDARSASWREAALARGARSAITIPLVYEESIYGILTVYGRTPQPDEREMDVLGELGDTIAHAINAVEVSITRRTNSVVEPTLQTTTADTPLVRLARETGAVVEFEGLVPGSDGNTTVFFTARDASPDEIVAAGGEILAIEELHHMADRDTGSQFKMQVVNATLANTFLERGATIRSLTINAGTATAVVELSESADVREFVEGLQRAVPDLELLARRSRTQTHDEGYRLQTAFEERLTPRQQEVIQLAYRSGYFELPRVQSGKELSEALDISQSTFNYHLRGAERKLLGVVFDHA